jgi:hypothetical protein
MRSEAEPLDAIPNRARGREHQDPALRTRGHHGPADVVAMHTREVAVQNHNVVGGHGDVLERVAAVEDDIDCHPLLAQAGRHRYRQFRVVLDHQDPQSRTVTNSPPRTCGGPTGTGQGVLASKDDRSTVAKRLRRFRAATTAGVQRRHEPYNEETAQ